MCEYILAILQVKTTQVGSNIFAYVPAAKTSVAPGRTGAEAAAGPQMLSSPSFVVAEWAKSTSISGTVSTCATCLG